MSEHNRITAADTALRALMSRYQEGDLDAFDEIYRRLAARVRSTLARHRVNAAQLDDLMQETFLQIHRARHTYDPAYPVLPWAAAIARHVALMHHRVVRDGRRPPSS